MAKRAKNDVITQALLLGFGLMDVTSSRVGKIIKDVKKDRNITDARSRKVANDFLKGLEKSRKDVDTVIRKHIKRAIKDLDIATKQDIERLRKRRK